MADSHWKLVKNCDYYALGASLELLPAIEDCKTTSVNITAFGQSLIAAPTTELLQTYRNITERVQAIQSEMGWYYKHIFKYTNQSECYTAYLGQTKIVVDGANELLKYLDGQ